MVNVDLEDLGGSIYSGITAEEADGGVFYLEGSTINVQNAVFTSISTKYGGGGVVTCSDTEDSTFTFDSC